MKPIVKTEFSPRATLLADAALRVLGEHGARALTHRAVDRVAGLPEGSTSNLFRTREALVIAASERLTELDLERAREIETEVVNGHTAPKNLAVLLAALVDDWATVNPTQSSARLELYLEGRRQPGVAAPFARQRQTFLDLTATVVAHIETPDLPHPVAVIAMVEGLLINQLLHPATRVTRDELVQVFGAFLGLAASSPHAP